MYNYPLSPSEKRIQSRLKLKKWEYRYIPKFLNLTPANEQSILYNQIRHNQHLNEYDAKFTCAHELGHAVLHQNASTPFLRSKTFLSVDKLEIEANTFAVNLLIPDEIIVENMNYTTEQLSRLLGYNRKLIELRLKTFCADENRTFFP